MNLNNNLLTSATEFALGRKFINNKLEEVPIEEIFKAQIIECTLFLLFSLVYGVILVMNLWMN